MPCACMFYCFLWDSDLEERITCLVCRDQDTKTTFADRLGYQKISIKTDQEPALVALANEIKNQREQETMLETSK
eukprot:14185170-Heterocapsa_arctica.AAC.1